MRPATYVFPNVTADTYTVEVTLEAFKTVKRGGITVSGGDRVGIPPLTLEPGALAETVTVVGQSPLVQTQSGERSFAVSSKQIETLPFARNNFTSVTAFAPGVVQVGASAGGTRIGGAGQNNIMMDGISAMDTGNNGQMLNMNVDAIGEVKILTQGYQAEYGRSSGLQITAVTKSGIEPVPRFGVRHPDQLGLEREQLGQQQERRPEGEDQHQDAGLHHRRAGRQAWRQQQAVLLLLARVSAGDGGDQRRQPDPHPRADGARARRRLLADARQHRRALQPDQGSALDCCRARRRAPAGCFQDGGVLGKIPANRLYRVGQAILNRYPLPNVNQVPGSELQLRECAAPTTDNLTQQPAIRVDYQLSQKLRVTGKYSGQRARKLVTPGAIQGFNDVQNPYPFITNYGVTVNYQLNNSTFVEGTYGFIRNQLAGGGSIGGNSARGGMLVNDVVEPLEQPSGLPAALPERRRGRSAVLRLRRLERSEPGLVGRQQDQPAAGVRVGHPHRADAGGTAGIGDLPGPPNQLFPGFLNINRTQDVAISLTKVWGAHTSKAGFYNNHSFKAQNTGAGGVPGLGFQGFVNFGNDTNNALDTRLRLRERGGRRVHAVPPAVEADRRQHDLQQHRVLPAGQLEGERPADARLRPALHAPAAAVRPVPADVELLPGSVVAGPGAAPLHLRLQQRRDRLLRATRAMPSIRATGRS